MAPKCEFLFNSYNILYIFVVAVPECFQNLNFNFTLFMKLLPILKDFNSACFFVFMIITSKHNTKSTSTQFLLNFISIMNIVFLIINEISLIIIKSMIINTARIFIFGVFILTSQLILNIRPNTFILLIEITIVNRIIIHGFISFILW